MPSLTLFGRRTFFAGDDMRLVAMTCFIYRFTELSLIVSFFSIVFVRHDLGVYHWAKEYCFDDDGTRSKSNWFVQNALAISYVYALLGFFLAIAGIYGSARLYFISGRGTPTNTKPRHALYPLSYVHLTLFNVLRILTGLLGIICISTIGTYCDCVTTPSLFDDDGTNGDPAEELNQGPIETVIEKCISESRLIGVFAAIVIMHFIDMCYSFATILYFFCGMFPNIRRRMLSPETECIMCCRCCFGILSCLTCCLYGGAEAIRGGDLSNFALKITNYFETGGILDVAPSDIMAGLTMVKSEHLQAQITSRERLLKATNEASMELEESQGNQNEATARPDQRRARSMTAMVQDSTKLLKHLTTESQIESGMEAITQAWNRGQSLTFRSVPNPSDFKKTFAPMIRETLSLKNPYEKYLIAEGARFICISEAIYDWSSARQQSLLKSCCCSCVLVKDATLDELMSFYDHILEMAPVFGLKNEDIVHAQWHEGLGKTPYAIVLDHAWKSVVVAIRGSVSLEDMLEDISSRPDDLTEVGEQHGFDGEGRYCHAGILGCAQWIYEDLQRHGKLKELLGENGTHSGYRLRVTGHSLGAGAAVILTLLLRCEYRNARCLAFSPPGCTTSANLADECSEWTTSYILDTDIIPRVSVESFEALRDETLEMIARIKIPKYKVVRYRDQKDGKGIALDEFLAYSLHHKGDIEESKFLEQLREFREFQKSLKAKHQLHYVSLFPPGKIIQLFGSDNFAEKMMRADETMASSDVVIENPYTARWAEKTDFREVILSSHFLSDHKTANVKAELHAMAKRFGLEQPFSSVLSWGDDLNV